MKYTGRHGTLWERVDRLQTAPDMKKTVHTEKPTQCDDYHLKNSYRS